MNKCIEIKNLKKSYKNFSLNDISFSIPSGEIIGLIGENGAGKTTMIKSILNIINCEGQINVFNKNHISEEKIIKKDIGVVLDNSFFPEILNSMDINKIMSYTYDNWDKDMFFNYLKIFNIPPRQTLKTLSKGMRKKVEIASSLSHHPKLLILDEPTSGLDPVVRSEILDIFQNFIKDDEHTILLSTHITSDLERVADHIVFIDNGSLIFNKTRDEVLDNYGVLKCADKEFEQIDKKDIISYRRNKLNYDVLVSNRNLLKTKYNFIIDKADLEDIMVLYIKGVK